MLSLIQPTVVGSSIPAVRLYLPLVVRSNQAGPINCQDAVSDPQSAVRGSRSVRDQSPDVNTRSIKWSVLSEEEYYGLCSVQETKKTQFTLQPCQL